MRLAVISHGNGRTATPYDTVDDATRERPPSGGGRPLQSSLHG